MGGTDEGTVAVAVEAPTGIVAMKSALTEAMVQEESMMKGTVIMKVRAGGIGVKALAISENEAEVGALGEGGTTVRLGKAVRRDVPKLSSGTGKGNNINSKTILVRLTIMEIMMEVIMDMCRMEISMMTTSSSGVHYKKDIITDLFI